MIDLMRAIADATAAAEGAVLVTMARVRGSTPREVGAWMLIREDGFDGTIGGGNLELKAIDQAREMMADKAAAAEVVDYPLGPALGQCCGGVASLLFEPVGDALSLHFAALEAEWAAGRHAVSVVGLDPVRERVLIPEGRNVEALVEAPLREAVGQLVNALEPAPERLETAEGNAYLLQPAWDTRDRMFLFGAGHVGRAIAMALSPLEFSVIWADERDDEYPAVLPDNTEKRLSDDLVGLVTGEMRRGDYALVMTHDHQLDFEICEALLRRDDLSYVGLIGSDTKRSRFERRWRSRGVAEAAIDRLVCPIGIAGVTGKKPAEIAAAVAAEMLITRQQVTAAEEFKGTSIVQRIRDKE